LETRSFLTLEDVGREDIREILDLARAFAEGRVRDALENKTVCLAFFEASTRTAVSFELAARRSGAHVISLSEKGSAISKGESLIDTIVTLDRLGADAIVLRHKAAGAAALASSHTTAPVINAGDGCGQHPTQALLDLYALSNALGGFTELAGRRVAIVGDVLHSRVALLGGRGH
jgi:aspartate carbamoyltransferase catalytic subunit